MSKEEIKAFLINEGVTPNKFGVFIVTDADDTDWNLVYLIEDLLK